MKYLLPFFLFLAACAEDTAPLGLVAEPDPFPLHETLIGKWIVYNGPDITAEHEFIGNGVYCFRDLGAGQVTPECGLWVVNVDIVRTVKDDGTDEKRLKILYWDYDEMTVQPLGTNNVEETPFVMVRQQ